jgi:Predicted metal-dependent hydrolase
MTSKESFLFAKWPVEVHRRPFRRSLSVYLYPTKPIKVVANHSVTQKMIVDFLMAKHSWIEKTFTKFAAIEEKFPEKKIRMSEDFPFLGKDRKLKVVITLNKKPFVSMTDENLLLHIPRNEWSANATVDEHAGALKELREFYKREAVKHISERVKHWAHEMQLFPSQVKFREQKTRWGSCSSRKVVNLNWRLIVFAPEIVDYVIVHELAHLQHMNHSSNFWGLVAKYIENMEVHVKTLKESQHRVEFLSEK